MKIVRLFDGLSAKTGIADFGPGVDVFGVTPGHSSLIDLVDALVEKTGDADAVIATWTASGADLSRAETWLRSGRLRSARFLIDPSFQTRKPEFCETMRELFGDEAIRVCATHAKFVLLSNEAWRVVVFTSMNLNMNRRIENFVVTADPDAFEGMREIVERVYEIQGPGEGFGMRQTDVVRQLGVFRTPRSDFYRVKSGRELIGG